MEINPLSALKNSMGLKLIALMLVVALVLPASTKAIEITNCTRISQTGYYELNSDIYAWQGNASTPEWCIDLDAKNATLDLNGYSIYNRNASVKVGIAVNEDGVTVKNGEIHDFSYTNDSIGLLVYNGGSNINYNVTIDDIFLTNNTVNAELRQVTYANVKLAIDDLYHRHGIYAHEVRNSSFNIFSRTGKYPAIYENMNYSTVSGLYDGRQLAYKIGNQTLVVVNWWLNTISSGINFLSGGLTHFNWGMDLSNDTVIIESDSIGIVVRNNTFSTYYMITANGLKQGISTSGVNYNNTFGKINFPSSADGKGVMGGIYLSEDTTNNVLCEIEGTIFDDCGQPSANAFYAGLLKAFGVGDCSYKNNPYFDSCLYVSGLSKDLPSSQTSNTFMTPLYAFDVPDYQFINFFFTPFFITVIGLVGVTIYITKVTESSEFGLYSLCAGVVILALAGLFNFWFSFIFVILVGFVIMKRRSSNGGVPS